MILSPYFKSPGKNFFLSFLFIDSIHLNCSLRSSTILEFELLFDMILHHPTELPRGINKRTMGGVKCVGLKELTLRENVL